MNIKGNTFVVELSEAVNTNDLPIVLSYDTPGNVLTGVDVVTTMTSGTSEVAVFDPGDTAVVIESINVKNTDAIAHTVKFSYKADASPFTKYEIYQQQLQPGQTVEYTAPAGWRPPAAIVAPAHLPAGYLFGLTLSNSGATSLAVAAGQARSGADTADMVLASAITKSLAANWAVGSGNGGLDTGSKAANTWYYVFLITNGVTVDALFSAGLTPTLPSGYTAYRRIGAIRTDGSGNILAFYQNGSRFLWDSPVIDKTFANVTSNAAQLVTCTVPPGLVVEWFGSLVAQRVATDAVLYVSSPSVANNAATGANFTGEVLNLGSLFQADAIAHGPVPTNTSAQIRYRLSTASAVGTGVDTMGWIDSRGMTA